MRTVLHTFGMVLLALSVGCADFDKAEQSFCERNPDRCGPKPGEEEPVYSQVAFTTLPQTVQVGSCSAEVRAQLRDSSGTPVNVTTDTSVALSVTPSEGFEFFDNSSCAGSALTTVGVRAGSSSTGFYFKGTRAGSAMLTVSVGDVTGSQTVSLVPAAASALLLTLQETTVAAGSCTRGTVQVKDVNGSDTQVSTDSAVSLESNPRGGIAFYSDASCITPVQSATILANEGSATFYFQGQAEGSVTIAAALSGLTASQSVQVNPGSGNRLVFVTSSQTVDAGACSPLVQLQSQDAQGNAAPVTTDTTISLAASPSTGILFFTNSGCTGAAVSTVNLPAGQSTASFFFRGTAAQSVNVTVTGPGFTGSTQPQTIRAGPPAIISMTGPSTATAGDCNATQITLSLLDAYGNPSLATVNTSISLSVASGKPLTFSRTIGCASASSTVAINQSTGSATIFFRGTEAGASTIRATSGSLTAGTLNVTINAAVPTSIEFTTASQRIQVGNCSAVATVQLRDAYNNPAQAPTNTNVGLVASPSDTFQFFSGAGCTGSLVAIVTIPPGTDTANFSFRGNRSGTVVVTASLGSVTRTQSETLDPGTATTLVFSPSPVSIKAAECKQVNVQALDNFTNPAPVSGAKVVALTANPSAGFGFYSNSGCSAASSNATINDGQSSATFYVKGTTAGNVTVTGTNAQFPAVTLPVTVGPEIPRKLSFKTPAQQILKGACSAITTVEVQDDYNNASPIAAGAAVNLSSSTGNVTFHTDSSCATQAVTTVPVGANQSSASLYFKSSAYGNVTLTAASAPLISGTQAETINPIPPTALAFTTAPQTVPAGNCAKVTVQTRENGNPTTVTSNLIVALSASPATNFAFYSDASCNNLANQITITANGPGTADFYFKGTTAGTFGITASSGALTPATQTATIAALVASRVGFVTSSYTTVAEVCSSTVTIQSVDSYGNASPVTSATVVNLSAPGGSADPQFKFFSGANCTGSEITSVTIPTAPSTVSFSYRGRKAQGVTLTAGGNGLGNGTQAHTISPDTAKKLVFKTAAQTLLAGTCALRTVESQDAYDNPAVNPLTVTLSASETAEFFTASDCSPATLTTQVSIPAGMSTATFYFKGYKGGDNANLPLALTASAAGLTPATQSNNAITPTVRTGSCPLASNNVTILCPITPALANGNKAFLTFQAITQDTRSDAASVRCRVYSVDHVACDRETTSTNPVSIHWRVAEFPNGVVTQNPVVNCVGNLTTVDVGNVDSTRNFLLLSSQRKGADQESAVPRLAELTSNTQAEIRKTGGCTSPSSSDSTNLQVVDYTGASVRRGVVTSMTAGVATTTASLASVVPSRSILLYSYIYGGPSSQYCDRAVRGALTNETTVTFSRGEGDATNCAGVAIPAISWEVVEFPAGTVVQSLTRQLVALQSSLTVTLPTPVDPSRAVVIVGGQWASGQVHGEGKHTGVDGISDMRAMGTLSADGKTITLTRATFSSTATFTFFVIQLKP